MRLITRVAIACCLVAVSCAHWDTTLDLWPTSRMYDSDFNRTWRAVLDLLLDGYSAPLRDLDWRKGVVTTDQFVFASPGYEQTLMRAGLPALPQHTAWKVTTCVLRVVVSREIPTKVDVQAIVIAKSYPYPYTVQVARGGHVTFDTMFSTKTHEGRCRLIEQVFLGHLARLMESTTPHEMVYKSDIESTRNALEEVLAERGLKTATFKEAPGPIRTDWFRLAQWPHVVDQFEKYLVLLPNTASARVSSKLEIPTASSLMMPSKTALETPEEFRTARCRLNIVLADHAEDSTTVKIVADMDVRQPVPRTCLSTGRVESEILNDLANGLAASN